MFYCQGPDDTGLLDFGPCSLCCKYLTLCCSKKAGVDRWISRALGHISVCGPKGATVWHHWAGFVMCVCMYARMYECMYVCTHAHMHGWMDGFNRLVKWSKVVIWTKWFWSFMLPESVWGRLKSLSVRLYHLKLVIFRQSEFLLASYIVKTCLFACSVGTWPSNHTFCCGIKSTRSYHLQQQLSNPLGMIK